MKSYAALAIMAAATNGLTLYSEAAEETPTAAAETPTAADSADAGADEAAQNEAISASIDAALEGAANVEAALPNAYN